MQIQFDINTVAPDGRVTSFYAVHGSNGAILGTGATRTEALLKVLGSVRKAFESDGYVQHAATVDTAIHDIRRPGSELDLDDAAEG